MEINSPAKYINSPETPLFRKSHLLYGLDLAKEAIHKQAEDGDGDGGLYRRDHRPSVRLHNAVAVLGMALGETHIKILKRFVDRIVLVLDGDEAGQKRANEVLELFIAQQADLRILTLPDDLDPCDFLHSSTAPRRLPNCSRRGTVDALDHAFLDATRGIDLERDIHAASQAMERLIAIIAKAPRLQPDTSGDDRLREERFLQRFAAMFRVSESGSPPPVDGASPQTAQGTDRQERRPCNQTFQKRRQAFALHRRAADPHERRTAGTARRLSRNMVRSPGGTRARTSRVARAAANLRYRMPALGRRRAAWL